eukprot:2448082-Pleurochrysis_carterae.AAC.1
MLSSPPDYTCEASPFPTLRFRLRILRSMPLSVILCLRVHGVTRACDFVRCAPEHQPGAQADGRCAPAQGAARRGQGRRVGHKAAHARAQKVKYVERAPKPSAKMRERRRKGGRRG